jgi:hypothetical protein
MPYILRYVKKHLKERKNILFIAIGAGVALLIFGIIAWSSGNEPTDEPNPETPSETKEQPFELKEFDVDTFHYIQVIDSCGPYEAEACLNVRSGPGTDHPKVATLRSGIVLQSAGTVERDGYTWHKIVFNEWLRYPERVTGDWYVADEFVEVITNESPEEFVPGETPPTKKFVVISLSEQKLYAYNGHRLYMETSISTGLDGTPTDPGTFHVFRKLPSRYMQGPLPGSDDHYDLPGVPWNMYFTDDGAVIHGAYWHEKFGTPASHGCVNLPPEEAEKLYRWAELGMKVVVVE